MEPDPRYRGQSRGAGGGAPKGEKESAAESKRLIGEDCRDPGPLGFALARSTERSSAGRPSTHPAAFAEPAQLLKKGESRAAVRTGGIILPQKLRVDGFLEMVSFNPPVLQKGKLRNRAKQWPG